MNHPAIKSAVVHVSSFIVLAAIAGCMYSFSGSSVPPHLRTIAIPLFDDQSGFGEPGLRESFTKKLIDLFVNDNSLSIADKNSADSKMEGTITSIVDAPSVITAGEQVSKRKITITVHAVFTDMKLRKKMWEKDFTNWGEYSSGSEIRSVALEQAAAKVTEDMLLETVSGW